MKLTTSYPHAHDKTAKRRRYDGIVYGKGKPSEKAVEEFKRPVYGMSKEEFNRPVYGMEKKEKPDEK